MKDYMGELERERYCMFLVALKIAGELLEITYLLKRRKQTLRNVFLGARKLTF